MFDHFRKGYVAGSPLQGTKKVTRKPRAYSYVRFSTPEQMAGASYKRQTEASELWAKTKGIPLDDSLKPSDLGVSAFRGKNATDGQLRDFLIAIETRKVVKGDYFIVESIDRISRAGLVAGQAIIGQILSAGVSIVTLNPEREFTAEGQNEIGQAIEVMIVLGRAWEESQRKSERVGDAWKRKREIAEKQILTSRAPSWCRARKDRTGFDPIKKHVQVVKYIYELAENFGLSAIAKTLDSDGIPPISQQANSAKRWATSSIRRILSDRSVLGEFQPHTRTDEERKPTGKPIKDYYPRIIADSQFYRVQKALSDRRSSGGPVVNRGSNLFTKLVFDSEDNPCHYRASSETQTYLRSNRVSIPYPLLEKSLIVWARELDLSMVAPTDKQRTANMIPDMIDRVDGINQQIEETKKRIKTGKRSAVLLEFLEELGEDRERALAELESARVASSDISTDSFMTIKDLIDKAGADSITRARLRRALQRLIKKIVILGEVEHIKHYKICVELHNGSKYLTSLFGTRIHWGCVITPKKYVDGQFDLVDEFPELKRYSSNQELKNKILEHAKTSLTYQEIADELGTTISVVSKTLYAAGKKRFKSKPADSPHVMNWHEAGRGWVKTKNKKRFFVGCGTLIKQFPRLVKGEGKNAHETYRAANRWWKNNHA